MSSRIYLDNAATSWPKPEPVYNAVARYLQIGAPAGRSGYAEAAEAERAIDDARLQVAQLMGAEQPRQVVFGCNGTDVLNLAIHGIVRPGDHVVTTDAEHNSVLRPLRFLEERAGVEISRVPCDGRGLIDPQAVIENVRPQTRLVAVLHASNVTGAIQPIAEIAKTLPREPTFLLVDAAQSLGHFPVDVSDLGCDLLAASGHKGLLGPLGTGVLYIGPRAAAELQPTRQGGTGTRSEDDRQPETLPDRFESGNHNVPALAGLREGLKWHREQGLESLRKHEIALTAELLDGLSSLRGVVCFGPQAPEARVGVVSVQVPGYDPQEVATMLDSAFRIQVRAGLHCAPRMHRALGTLESGGAVRLSIGPFTTSDDVDRAVEALGELTAHADVGGNLR